MRSMRTCCWCTGTNLADSEARWRGRGGAEWRVGPPQQHHSDVTHHATECSPPTGGVPYVNGGMDKSESSPLRWKRLPTLHSQQRRRGARLDRVPFHTGAGCTGRDCGGRGVRGIAQRRLGHRRTRGAQICPHSQRTERTSVDDDAVNAQVGAAFTNVHQEHATQRACRVRRALAETGAPHGVPSNPGRTLVHRLVVRNAAAIWSPCRLDCLGRHHEPEDVHLRNTATLCGALRG